MDTPKVNRGAKASPVRVTHADGSVEMKAAYDGYQLARVVGRGRKPPGSPEATPKAKARWKRNQARRRKARAAREANQ